MAESVGEIIGNQWSGGTQVAWANLEWLKSLSSDQQATLAEQTKRTHKDAVSGIGDTWLNQLGYSDPPPEGSAVAEHDIKVNRLNDSEMAEWRDPIDVKENPALYDDIISDAEELTGDTNILSTVHDLARGSDVPEESNNFEIEAWWDDILDDV